MDCFAEPVIGRRFAPTRWLAMTMGPRHRPRLRASLHTGSAVEYFTWLTAKLDSIEAMPSRRGGAVLEKPPHREQAPATPRTGESRLAALTHHPHPAPH